MRRTKPETRDIPADVRYNSVPVTFFINRIMKRGKKSIATRMMYDAWILFKKNQARTQLKSLILH